MNRRRFLQCGLSPLASWTAAKARGPVGSAHALSARSCHPRVATGLRSLDALLDGGLPAGEVTLVVSAIGEGGRILQQNVMERFLGRHRRPVAYVAPFQYARTVMHCLACIRTQQATRPGFGPPRTPEQHVAFGHARRDIALGLSHHEAALDMVPSTYIEGFLCQALAKGRPGLVVVDDLTLYREFRSNTQSARSVRSIGRRLQHVARHVGAPVLVSCSASMSSCGLADRVTPPAVLESMLPLLAACAASVVVHHDIFKPVHPPDAQMRVRVPWDSASCRDRAATLHFHGPSRRLDDRV